MEIHAFIYKINRKTAEQEIKRQLIILKREGVVEEVVEGFGGFGNVH